MATSTMHSVTLYVISSVGKGQHDSNVERCFQKQDLNTTLDNFLDKIRHEFGISEGILNGHLELSWKLEFWKGEGDDRERFVGN